MILRRLLSLCLVMTMLVTSGSMAAMRGSEDGAQSFVICTGLGLQVITLGADGEELDPAPICPDCTLALEAGPLPYVALAISAAKPLDVASLGAPQGARCPAGLGAQPRAPPRVAV